MLHSVTKGGNVMLGVDAVYFTYHVLKTGVGTRETNTKESKVKTHTSHIESIVQFQVRQVTGQDPGGTSLKPWPKSRLESRQLCSMLSLK